MKLRNQINKSDRFVGSFLGVKYYVSGAVFVNKQFDRESLEYLQKAFGQLKTMLSLPEGITVRIAGQGAAYARYYHPNKLVNMDPFDQFKSSPMYRRKCMVSSLAHELVHAEQYNTGKLKHATTEQIMMYRRPVSVRIWNGEVVASWQAGSHDAPWEQEAYSRQDILAEEVQKRIG